MKKKETSEEEDWILLEAKQDNKEALKKYLDANNVSYEETNNGLLVKEIPKGIDYKIEEKCKFDKSKAFLKVKGFDLDYKTLIND